MINQLISRERQSFRQKAEQKQSVYVKNSTKEGQPYLSRVSHKRCKGSWGGWVGVGGLDGSGGLGGNSGDNCIVTLR